MFKTYNTLTNEIKTYNDWEEFKNIVPVLYNNIQGTLSNLLKDKKGVYIKNLDLFLAEALCSTLVLIAEKTPSTFKSKTAPTYTISLNTSNVYSKEQQKLLLLLSDAKIVTTINHIRIYRLTRGIPAIELHGSLEFSFVRDIQAKINRIKRVLTIDDILKDV